MLKNIKPRKLFLFLKFPFVVLSNIMREKIVQKATELFITLGFKSVTMDEIATEMGISKKTIYAHYKNKTDLVMESTMYMFDFITEGIDCIRGLEKNPIEELYEIKKFVMVHLKDDKSSPQYQLQKYYPEIYAELKKKHFEKMHDCMTQNVSRGIDQGLYRENLDVEFVSRIYFLGINGVKDNSLFPTARFPKPQLMEDYLEYHLRGVVTKEGLKTLKKFIKKQQL